MRKIMLGVHANCGLGVLNGNLSNTRDVDARSPPRDVNYFLRSSVLGWVWKWGRSADGRLDAIHPRDIPQSALYEGV